MKPSIVIQQGTQSQIFEKAENWDFVRDAAPVIWKAAHITNVSAPKTTATPASSP